MTDPYRIFGSEISPYSVKVRSYFRYKGIPHEWIERSNDNMAEYQKVARIPIIPAVATPEGEGIQDSTPIIDKLEAAFPEPSIHPSDPALSFLSALLEEFGDEWGNKWMFHFRWARPVDQDSTAQRIVRSMMPGLPDDKVAEMAEGIKDRMVNRVYFVGSNEKTAPQIEATFREFVQRLDAHLANRQYLFGARPSFGDFGLWGQIYNAWTDPTCKEIIESGGTHLVPWIQRMLDPKASGDFESWESLAPTLQPILADFVGGLYFPWIQANAAAFAAGEEEHSVALRSGTWTQQPQKYHVRSLEALRKRYAGVTDKSALDPILEQAGCLDGLRS